MALTLADRVPHPEEVKAWSEWTEEISRNVAEAAMAIQAVEESRRLNPRALAAANVYPGLRASLDRLERCLAAERSLVVVIGREAPSPDAATGASFSPELRRVFAVPRSEERLNSSHANNSYALFCLEQ